MLERDHGNQRPWRHWLLGLALVAIITAVACGVSATPAPDAGPSPTTATETEDGPTDTPVPTSEPGATSPGTEGQPSGTLNVGFAEFGKFEGHPNLTSPPRIAITNLAIGEGIFMMKQDLTPAPMLVESWEISDDFLTWTFNMRQGVQFHKGWGEMTAEDFVYSQREFGDGGFHARAAFIDSFWNHEDGSVEIVDDHTVKVNTGEPWVDGRVWEWMANLGGASSWVVSKKQSDEMGKQAASEDIAATGPFQIEEHQTNEFWRMSAVEDHWRKTPTFAELVFWELPEESARIAGFQTGNLDTFSMSFDTIPAVEEVEGAKLQSIPNAGQMGLNIYGQLYTRLGTPEQYEHYNPDNAWVSADPDVNSEEWAKARMVREAMAISIDREAITETLLGGYARPLPLRDWAGHESRMDPSWQWEYDPDRAEQLLADAGYPDGFSITLTPAIRNTPAEVEACEAVAQMWGDIGIDVQFQRIPYSTLRPTIINRNYEGATCHAVAIRLVVAIGASNYLDSSVFSYGTHHPILDELVGAAVNEVDPAQREQKEKEVYQFMFDNVMAFGLYSYDAVWPVGPDIEEWDPVSYGDIRQISGFENVRPR